MAERNKNWLYEELGAAKREVESLPEWLKREMRREQARYETERKRSSKFYERQRNFDAAYSFWPLQ